MTKCSMLKGQSFPLNRFLLHTCKLVSTVLSLSSNSKTVQTVECNSPRWWMDGYTPASTTKFSNWAVSLNLAVFLFDKNVVSGLVASGNGQVFSLTVGQTNVRSISRYSLLWQSLSTLNGRADERTCPFYIPYRGYISRVLNFANFAIWVNSWN